MILTRKNQFILFYPYDNCVESVRLSNRRVGNRVGKENDLVLQDLAGLAKLDSDLRKLDSCKINLTTVK